jgi:hypothetical protein
LPLAALDNDGNETPVKYHAVLVSLEGKGQFGQLLEKAPPHAISTGHAVFDTSVVEYTAAEYDHDVMESTYASTTFLGAGAGAGGGVPGLGAPPRGGGCRQSRAVGIPDDLHQGRHGTGE